MRTTNWKDIAELVGIAAIVASLIFVGLQMKQSQEIAIAAQYQMRAQATMDYHLVEIQLAQDEAPNEAGKGRGLSERDIAEIRWGLIAFDNHHFQHTLGFLSDDAWDGFVRAFTPMFENCVPRRVFEANRHIYRSAFVKYIESSIGSCKADALP